MKRIERRKIKEESALNAKLKKTTTPNPPASTQPSTHHRLGPHQRYGTLE